MHSKFMFYLFADDTSILYGNKNLKSLELEVNVELNKLCEWLTANKLTLMLRNLIILCDISKLYAKEAIFSTNDKYFLERQIHH